MKYRLGQVLQSKVGNAMYEIVKVRTWRGAKGEHYYLAPLDGSVNPLYYNMKFNRRQLYKQFTRLSEAAKVLFKK